MTELAHYGTPRHSGRYPWGSGENPYQSSTSFLAQISDLKAQGLTEAQIAQGMGISTTQLRAQKTIARNEKHKGDISEAARLKAKGYSNVAIGERMGIPESSVRALLKPTEQTKVDILKTTSDMLKQNVKDYGLIDVGVGTELDLGISKEKLGTAVAMLQEEGYKIHYVKVEQLGTGKFTTVKVLSAPDVPYSEVVKNRGEIQLPGSHSNDGGLSYSKLHAPVSVDSKRVEINYGPDGGTDKDGLIELRRDVDDISMGSSNYAQVRIAVDGTHYLKGMAVYSDDLPKGVDIRFNTNKSDTGNKLDALKELTDDPNNPFGAQIKPGGQRGALNIVNEEGDWGKWSKTLSSQMLSKQNLSLAKRQLDLAYSSKKEEFDEISKLTNPVVKRTLLQAFSDSCDSAATHLKAAAMPRQRTHAILPIPSMKETEVYAPNYENGEKVVLIRFPHGGTFEIPELTVNNRSRNAKKVMDRAPDAIGINAKVAERLSGADFDGDTVLVIPNNNGAIKTSPSLKGLKDFNPSEAYPPYDGMRTVDGGTWDAKKRKAIFEDGKKPSKASKQQKMGDVSNLITDMTIKGASQDELARAVRHSMVVIDSEKHALNYKQSYSDNGIAALKQKYQGGSKRGASTLLSRASSDIRVPDRRLRRASEGGPIDLKTGAYVYTETGKSYKDIKGRTVKRTVSSTKMAETKDAQSLSSGTNMEGVYSKYANSMKAMGNEARKMYIATKPRPYSPSARKTYSAEVGTLRAKLNVALKNAPLERRAQVLANVQVATKIKDNPGMDKDAIRKIKGQALNTARERVGAKKQRVQITDKEWSAIQAGAISTNMLTSILSNADLDRVKELATPRTQRGMTASKKARAKSMYNAGYTQAEIAKALGVSVTTLSDVLK